MGLGTNHAEFQYSSSNGSCSAYINKEHPQQHLDLNLKRGTLAALSTLVCSGKDAYYRMASIAVNAAPAKQTQINYSTHDGKQADSNHQ